MSQKSAANRRQSLRGCSALILVGALLVAPAVLSGVARAPLRIPVSLAGFCNLRCEFSALRFRGFMDEQAGLVVRAAHVPLRDCDIRAQCSP